MSRRATAESVVLGWARWYTRGLADDDVRQRLDELLSDCHEQRTWGAEVGASRTAVATSMVSRTLTGMPADLLWRRARIATARDRSLDTRGRPMGRWVRENWWLVLAGLAGAMQVVLGAGLPFEDRTLGSVVGGALILAAGVAMLVGIRLRRRRRVAGDLAIAAGALPLMPWLWTVVLPAVGLTVIVASVIDAADATARGTATRPPAPREAPVPGHDRVGTGLLAALAAAVVAVTVIGDAPIAIAVVTPTVTLLGAWILLRRLSPGGSPATRAGLVLVVTGIVGPMATTVLLLVLAGDDVAAISALRVVGTVGTFLTVAGAAIAVVGAGRRRDRARPA